jgi:hypothetical protein
MLNETIEECFARKAEENAASWGRAVATWRRRPTYPLTAYSIAFFRFQWMFYTGLL